MKRLICVAIAVVTVLLGFYIAWPAWSAHRISSAIRDDNPDLLASKVDFPSLQASLRPILAAELDKNVERLAREQGPLGGLIAAGVRGEFGQRLLDRAIVTGVSPNNVIRMAREGRNMREALQKILIEQMGKGPSIGAPASPESERSTEPTTGKIGTILGQVRQAAGNGRNTSNAGTPQPTPSQGAPSSPKGQFGLANIKSVALNGPTALTIGIARDPSAKTPELLVHFAFKNVDWKVVGLTPQLTSN